MNEPTGITDLKKTTIFVQDVNDLQLEQILLFFLKPLMNFPQSFMKLHGIIKKINLVPC